MRRCPSRGASREGSRGATAHSRPPPRTTIQSVRRRRSTQRKVRRFPGRWSSSDACEPREMLETARRRRRRLLRYQSARLAPSRRPPPSPPPPPKPPPSRAPDPAPRSSPCPADPPWVAEPRSRGSSRERRRGRSTSPPSPRRTRSWRTESPRRGTRRRRYRSPRAADTGARVAICPPRRIRRWPTRASSPPTDCPTERRPPRRRRPRPPWRRTWRVATPREAPRAAPPPPSTAHDATWHRADRPIRATIRAATGP
mmetsp:Transcript_9098/g.41194  ORF Transcript_9098/g.41194 Transcript_9098/m.41194 type:complete len:256 (-) Transcript_9098:942-1709(-)